MAEAASRSGMTYAEYLAFERPSSSKHEFVDGHVFAMAGGTTTHSLVAANITRALGNALADGPCRVFTWDMRIRTGDDVAAYPDVSVVCGKLEVSDDRMDELRNPLVLVEVLSDSTEAYDRGDKFLHYQSIASLREVVFASTKSARLDHYTRQSDGSWVLRMVKVGDVVRLASARCELRVDDAYAKAFDDV